MKKRWRTIIGMAVALAIAAAVSALALADGRDNDVDGLESLPSAEAAPTYEQWLADSAVKAQQTVNIDRSDEEGEPEPPFVDGEPEYVVQSLREANETDCGLAGGAVYVTSEGEVGCVVVHDIQDNGENLASTSQPPTIEPQPMLATPVAGAAGAVAVAQ